MCVVSLLHRTVYIVCRVAWADSAPHQVGVAGAGGRAALQRQLERTCAPAGIGTLLLLAYTRHTPAACGSSPSPSSTLEPAATCGLQGLGHILSLICQLVCGWCGALVVLNELSAAPVRSGLVVARD